MDGTERAWLLLRLDGLNARSTEAVARNSRAGKALEAHTDRQNTQFEGALVDPSQRYTQTLLEVDAFFFEFSDQPASTHRLYKRWN